MKRLSVIAAAIALSACSSMPAWMPGSGWTTLIDGDKGRDNFTQVGDANWRADGGAIVADKSPTTGFLLSKKSYKVPEGPFALQFANLAKNAPGGPIKFRKVQVREL